MIEPFEFLHPEVRLSTERTTLSGRLFRDAILPIIHASVHVENQGLIGRTKRIESLEKAFITMMELTLVETGVTLRLYGHERRVVESIILQKFRHAILNSVLRESREAITWAQLAGTMIQQRLTLSLLELEERELAGMMEWGQRFPILEEQDWSRAFVGAASVTRTILAAQRIQGVRIYMPTAYEDMARAIDFFVLHEEVNLAVSVKTSGRDDGFLVTTPRRPLPGQRSGFPLELLHIFSGAAWVSEEYGREFRGIHVAASCAPRGGDVVSLEGDTIAFYNAMRRAASAPESEATEKATILVAAS